MKEKFIVSSKDAEIHSFVPMYTKILNKFDPTTVFEWGPGLNTMLALYTDSIQRIVSIEFDARWIKHYDERLASVIVPIESEMYTTFFGLEDIDLYFVDSRRRADCLLACFVNAKDEALICLHDAGRISYHSALSEFPHVHFFDAGFAVATKSSKIYDRLKNL